MSMRISGKNMHFSLGDYKLKASKVTLSITDNSAVQKKTTVCQMATQTVTLKPVVRLS